MSDALATDRPVARPRRRATFVSYGLVTLAYAVVLLLVQRRDGTDDFTFALNIAPFPTIGDWIAYRYESWSGRILPEAWLYVFTTAPLIWWQLASLVLSVAFVALLVLYARLARPAADDRTTAGYVLVAGALVFLLDVPVLSGGYTWVTGSMNYFWLMPFALAGFYPLARLYSPAPRLAWPWVAGAVAAAFVAAVSAEQVGAILLVLAVLVVCERALAAARRRASWRSLATAGPVAAAAAVGFAILMGAPGNAQRSAIDASVWLPEFPLTPLSERLPSAVRFVVDGLVNHGGMALPLIWATLLGGYFALRRSRTALDHIVALVAIVGLSTVFIRSLAYGTGLYALYPGWLENPQGLVPAAVLAFWLLLLLATALAPFALLRSRLGALVSLLILGAAAALAAITLSASMYASGPRVVFIPALVILIGGFCMLVWVLRQRPHAWLAAGPLVVVAGYQYAAVAVGLVQG